MTVTINGNSYVTIDGINYLVSTIGLACSVGEVSPGSLETNKLLKYSELYLTGCKIKSNPILSYSDNNMCVLYEDLEKTIATYYTVTYDLNGGMYYGGSTPPELPPVLSGTIITLPLTGIHYNGPSKVFAGWKCSINNVTYPGNTSYTMTASNTTFTALWTNNTQYTTSYNLNGGLYNGSSTPPASRSMYAGIAFNLPTPAPTKSSYAFTGWKSSYDNQLYLAEQMCIMPSLNTIFTALWGTEDPNDCLYFLSAGNSTISLRSKCSNHTVLYSKTSKNGPWTNMTTSTTVNLSDGEICYIKGILSANASMPDSTQFNMSGSIKAYGNIMCLWNLTGAIEPVKECAGYRLFYNCAALLRAPKLPAIFIGARGYSDMFGNTSIIVAPELPATGFGTEGVYSGMFVGCTLLITPPSILPNTTLVSGCYTLMFSGCTALTSAPELPATNLASGCYQSMFYGCTSLTNVQEELPAQSLNVKCYTSMFENCTSLTKAPNLPADSLADSCYERMFCNCTSLIDVLQKLEAEQLKTKCYSQMFRKCTSLINAPELPSKTLAMQCYHGMFGLCKSLVDAPELPAEILATYCYVNMFIGCSNLRNVICYASVPGNNTYDWLYGVPNTSSDHGDFYKSASSTWSTGESGIPSYWTIHNITS